MSYVTSNPLNNSTNTNKQWRKPDIQLARSAQRELELSKIKHSQQSSQNTSSQPKEKENEHVGYNGHKFTSTEIKAKKKKFVACRFYLDNLDPQINKRVERGVKLLGAGLETFFSNKCTHLITTKTIPVQENLLEKPLANSEILAIKANNSRKAMNENTAPRDQMIENALKWNITLWSVDVMLKTLDLFLVPSDNASRKTLEKKGLEKVLQDEKIFGPSTGAKPEAQSKRPHFVPFTGHYLIVEDASQAHRPVVLKEYCKELIPSTQKNDLPWPHLKPTGKFRSPFGKRVAPKRQDPADVNVTAAVNDKENTISPVENNAKAVTASPSLTVVTKAKNDVQRPVSMAMKKLASPVTPLAGIISNSPSPSPLLQQQFSGVSTAPSTPTGMGPGNNPDSYSLRASGFQPSINTTNHNLASRSVSTSTTTMMQNNSRRLPPGESVNRLDKRMVENVTQKEHLKMNNNISVKSKDSQQQQPLQGMDNNHNRNEKMTKNPTERAQKEVKRKKDLRFCENCNAFFEKLEDHIKQESHQTFVKDQNNFKDLDTLLAMTHRHYKNPLPDHLRPLTDTSIDGKNTKFVSDLNKQEGGSVSKRSRPAVTCASEQQPQSKLTTNTMLNSKQKVNEPPHIIAPNDPPTIKRQDWEQYHCLFLE